MAKHRLPKRGRVLYSAGIKHEIGHIGNDMQGTMRISGIPKLLFPVIIQADWIQSDGHDHERIIGNPVLHLFSFIYAHLWAYLRGEGVNL